MLEKFFVLTFSIASGIGIGFVSYCAVKLLTGRRADIGPVGVVIALAFAAKVALT
jgi:adenine/guanine/hypoxanthine permease